MKKRHHKTYNLLKKLGFSPCKALEIVISAQRGDTDAVKISRFAWRFPC